MTIESVTPNPPIVKPTPSDRFSTAAASSRTNRFPFKRPTAVLSFLLALLPGAKSSATTALAVNCGSTIRSATHAGSGSLYGLLETKPADLTALVAPLVPHVFRNPPRSGNSNQHPFGAIIPVVQRLAGPVPSASVQVILADLLPGFPYQYPGQSSWISQVTSFINDKQSAGIHLYGYEIWNEPKGTWNTVNGDFNSALWLPTYQKIRQLDPSVPIIGPSYAIYNHSDMLAFMTWCKTNNCLPDIASWHELSTGVGSVSGHITDYRSIESSLGLSRRKITINEYCDPDHNLEGQPGSCAMFLGKFERYQIDSACISWWFTAVPGRLGSLLATDTAKGAGWWFFNWYGQMNGNMVTVTPTNEATANLDGLASVDSGSKTVTVLCGGGNDGTISVAINSLPSFVGSSANVTVQAVSWVSKDTVSSGPTTISSGARSISNGSLTVTISGANASTGYRIALTPATVSGADVWLEAERGVVGSLWQKPSDSTASNGVYCTITPGNNSTASAPTSSSGWIQLPFTVGTAGTYNLWFRTECPDANGDSFWVRVDNGSWTLWNGITSSSTWGWNEFSTAFSLGTGSHTLDVAYREDGAKLDKVYFTTGTTVPSGTGGAANN